MQTSTHTAIIFFTLMLPSGAFASVGSDLGSKVAQQGTPQGVAPCMSCHGPDGAGIAPAGYPRIAGLDAGYLTKQLKDFRAGKRNNPVMMPMAINLTDEEIGAVSVYYAGLPVPAPATRPPVEAVEGAVLTLAQWGDWSQRRIPACDQCHGPGGNGIGSHFPGISGQHAGYIKAQLQTWKSGGRSNDPLGMMKTVADQLADAEIDTISAYYAALPGALPTPATNTPSPVVGDKTVAAEDVVSGQVLQQGAPPAGRTPGSDGYFQSPGRKDLTDSPFDQVVLRGQAIFDNTNAHPTSSKYVGNDQACGNCHIDSGRLAESAPLWAAWVAYPAYRAKNQKVNTFIERIQGCFEYSMNAQASSAGGAPAANSDTIVSLVAYSFWLAKGAPTGDETLPGRGYPRLKETEPGFDPERGAVVYAARCALCHGDDGAGVTYSDGTTLFPALWGADSYNWGAGMHKIDTAAAFIKHNMPLGLGGSLSDQDAWDAAAYMNSHERPQDPRHQGDLAATTEQFHGGRFDYYGQRNAADGSLLGDRPSTR